MSEPKIATLTDQTAKLASGVVMIDVTPMITVIKGALADITPRLHFQKMHDLGHLNLKTQHTDAPPINLRTVLLGIFTFPLTCSYFALMQWRGFVSRFGCLGLALTAMRSWFGVSSCTNPESGNAQATLTHSAFSCLTDGKTAVLTKFSDIALQTFALWTSVVTVVHHASYHGPVCADYRGPVCADGGGF